MASNITADKSKCSPSLAPTGVVINPAVVEPPAKKAFNSPPPLVESVPMRQRSADQPAQSARVIINAVLPALITEMRTTGLPLQLTNAASVSSARQQLDVPKNHCYDAALQGRDFQTIEKLPNQLL